MRRAGIDKNNEPRVIACQHIGCWGITKTFVRKREDGRYEVRTGVALLGHLNDERSTDGNPFDDDFKDNYVRGMGATEEEALINMERDWKDLVDLLFSQLR